jgi:hypothetical protein
MAEIKLYGTTKRALAYKSLASMNTAFQQLAKQKNEEIEKTIRDFELNSGNFWGNIGSIGADFLGNTIGGIVNSIGDYGVAAQTLYKQFAQDLNYDQDSTLEIDDVAYAGMNAFISSFEGIFRWAGTTGVEAAREILKLGSNFSPEFRQFLNTSQNVSQLASLSSGRVSGNPIGDLMNFYGPGGQNDRISNWFGAQKADLRRGQLGQRIFQQRFTDEEIAQDQALIDASFSDKFLNDIKAITEKSSSRREYVDNMFQNKEVTALIEQGGAMGEFAQFTRGVSQSVGRMLPSIALTLLGGKLSANLAPEASKALSLLIKFGASSYFAGSVFGMSMEEAMKNGTSYDDALTYAYGSAISELMIEQSSGIVLGESIAVDSWKAFFKTMLNEAMEEAIAEIGAKGFSRLSRPDGEVPEEMRQETSADFFKRVFLSSLSGAVSSGILGGGSFVKSAFTLGGNIQAAETSLSQNIADIGIDEFSKEAGPRLQRVLKRLNSSRYTIEQKREAIKNSPLLKAVIEEGKMTTPTGELTSDVVFKLNEKGQRIIEGKLTARQGEQEISPKEYAVTKANYLTDYVEDVPRVVLNAATGQKERLGKTKIKIVKNTEIDALPESVKKDVNFIKKNFDNVAFVKNTEKFDELAASGKVVSTNGFNAFYDENSGIIYVNVNQLKDGGAVFNLIAHEISDKLDADFKAGRMTKKAARAWVRFQQLASKFTKDVDAKLTLEGQINAKGTSLFFDEQAYRELYKNKSPKELEAILERERVSGFIETILAGGNKNETLLKAVARIKDKRVIGFLTTLGDEIFLKSLTSKFNKMGLGEKYIGAITTTFKQALIQAQENLKQDETIKRGLDAGSDNFSFSLIATDEDKQKNFVKDTIEGRMPLITEYFAQNTEESRTALKNLVFRDVAMLANNLMTISPSLSRTFESYKNLKVKNQDDLTIEEQQEIENIENTVLKELNIEVITPESELGQKGYIFRAQNYHFHKDEFSLLSKGFLGNNLQLVSGFSYDVNKNIFKMSFNRMGETGVSISDYNIYPRWVKPNGFSVKAPLVLNAALNQYALEYLLKYNVLPSQSFSVNSASSRFSPTNEFAEEIVDDQNNFYVSIVLNKNVLNARDTIVTESDIYTATRYFDMQDGKSFKLKSELTSATLPIKSKVKILQTTIEMMQRDANKQILESPDKELGLYGLDKLNVFVQNINNPSISPQQLKEEIESAQTAFARADLMEVFDNAVNSINKLSKEIGSMYDIGAVLNSLINPTTRSNADMSYFGLAKGNPNSAEFKEEVNRLLELREQYSTDFQNVADFYRITQYSIDTISEGKTTLEGNSDYIGAFVITQASQKKLVEKGVYKQLKDFASKNGIKFVEQTFTEGARQGTFGISLQQAIQPEFSKNESDLMFSLNTEVKPEVAARILGKVVQNINDFEQALEQSENYWKSVFSIKTAMNQQQLINYGKQYFQRLVFDALQIETEETQARVLYIFTKLVTPANIANTNNVIEQLFENSYPNQAAMFNALVSILSDDQTKIAMAQNLDFSLNDHFEDGSSFKEYLYNTSVVLRDYEKLRNVSRIGKDLNDFELIEDSFDENVLPAFVDGIDEESLSLFTSYQDMVDTKRDSLIGIIGYSLETEKLMYPNRKPGKIQMFRLGDFKKSSDYTNKNFGIFGKGYDAARRFAEYDFGIDYGSYGMLYRRSDFEVGENRIITNLKANPGSIGSYFTYTAMGKNADGSIEYLDNRLVIGDVLKNDKVITNPMVIEVGLGYEAVMTLLKNGFLPSQSVSVSFLNAPFYNTNQYSKEVIDSRNGYFKVHALVNKQALDEQNFLTLSDTFTPIKEVDTEGREAATFRLRLPTQFGGAEKAIGSEFRFDESKKLTGLMRQNLDLTALAMSLSIADGPLKMRDEWFKEDWGFSYNRFINLQHVEYTLRSLIGAGLSGSTMSTNAEQLKKRIENSGDMVSKSEYILAINSMQRIFNEAISLVQNIPALGARFGKEQLVVRVVAKYFADVYEASKGNKIDANNSISNVFLGVLETDFFKRAYKQLSKEFAEETRNIIIFFDSLPFMLDQVNEVKLSKLNSKDITLHVEHVGDINKSAKFQELKTLAEERGVNIVLKDNTTSIANLRETKQIIQDEIVDDAFGEQASNVLTRMINGSLVGSTFKDVINYELSKSNQKENMDRNTKAEAAALAIENNIAFSLKDSEAARAAKRKKFAELAKKVYGDKTKPVKTKKEKALEEKYADTPNQTAKVSQTLTEVSKQNFNTTLGSVELKNSSYNALVRVTKTIKDLIDYQRNRLIAGKERTSSFSKEFPQYSETFDRAIKELNSIKSKLEALVGLKKQVSPFDAALKADQTNTSLLTHEEISQLLEEQKTIVEMVEKETQPQGVLDKQNFFIDELIRRANSFAEQSVISTNTDGEIEYIAQPTLVEPEDQRKKISFQAYLKLMKLLNWLYKYRKSSAFSVKPHLLKEVNTNIVRLENIIRELVSTTNLQIKNVLDVFDPLVVKSENLIGKKDLDDVEKLLFKMTSLEAEKKYSIYLEAKEAQDKLLETIIQVAVQATNEAKAEASKGMEKEIAEQSKALEMEKAIKQQQAKVIRERLYKQRLSKRELKALWFRVYEQRVNKFKKFLDTLKPDSEEYEKNFKVYKRMNSTLSGMFNESWDKASVLTKDITIKIFNEMSFKDGEPNQIRELGDTSKIVQKSILDTKIKNEEEFIEKYGKRLFKLVKSKEERVDQRAAQPLDEAYTGPTYVTLDDIRFTSGKNTEAGTFVFERPKAISRRRGKVVDKPGVQVRVKGTKESRYFRTAEQAFRYINNRVNKFIEGNKTNEDLIKQSSGEKAQDVKPTSTQETLPLPKIEDVVAEPAKPITVPAEAPRSKTLWIPKEAMSVQYGEQTITITPSEVQELIKNKHWNFVSQEQWEQSQIANMQAIEEAQITAQEEQRIKALEAKQTLVTPAAPGTPGQPPSPKKGGVKNIFKTATKAANSIAKNTYEVNEKRFSEVMEVIVKRLKGSNRKHDQALLGMMERLEKVISKYRTENTVYNHVSSSAAKIIIENMDKIFRTITVKGKITRVPTDQELANIANEVNQAIYGALEYGDEQIRVRVNESATNPLGYLYTRAMHWFLRDMKKVGVWDANETEKYNQDERGNAWRRLMNAIYNFNEKGYGIVELSKALEGFHEATSVEPIVDASLNENEPRTVQTIVKQWLRNTTNIKEAKKAAKFEENVGELISPLLDPMTATEMIGLYNKRSWANVMMNKIIRGQERMFEIYRAFDGVFDDSYLKDNNANIIGLEKTKVKVSNLGGAEMAMSQVIYLRNMMFREIARNKAIDLGLIKGNKTNHFNNGYVVNILAITENRQKKQDSKTTAKIVDNVALLKELDSIIQANDFARDYNKKIYQVFNMYYPYINERFKELNGANLTNDGATLTAALAGASQSQQKSLFDVLPEGTKVEDMSNLYVPFLMDSSSYFKAQKIGYDNVLDMGVFDGMVLELSDSSGRVSVESINSVLEGYKREVANYYGLHRIMRDFNIITNYKLQENGQTYFINTNISEYAINYFKDLLMDMAGYGSIEYRSPKIQKWLPIIRQNFYVAALGFNVKVVATQFATMLNLWNIYGEGKMDFLTKMVKNMASQATGSNQASLQKMAENNNFYWDRSKGGTFEIGEATKEGVKARSVIETLKQFSMKGITLTDNLINKAFYLTLLETINPETGNTYTEAEANETLTIGIIRSQSSKLALSKSALLRSKNDLTRIFLRFMGEPLKLTSQYIASVKQLELISKLEKAQATIEEDQNRKIDEAKRIVAEAERQLLVQESVENMDTFATESEEYQALVRQNINKAKERVDEAKENQREVERSSQELNDSVKEIIAQKSAAKKLQKRRGAAIVSTISYLAILNFMWEMVRTGGGEKDKPKDEELFSHIIKKFGTKFFEEIIGMMPFVRDIYGAFNGYDLGNIAEFQAANEFFTSFGAIIAAFTQGNRINWNKTLYNLIGSAARMFGIPFKNIERLVTTPLLYISEPAWYQYNNFIGKQDRDNIELAEAIRTNDTAMISVVIDRKIAKREIRVSNNAADEMKRLASKGYEVSITGVPQEVEVGNKKRKLTSQEKEEFQKVYNRADLIIQKLLGSGQYKRLNDKSKARLLQAVYAYYHKLAKQEVLDIDTLSEALTFVSLNEAYNYFLGRATYYEKNQRSDDLVLDA